MRRPATNMLSGSGGSSSSSVSGAAAAAAAAAVNSGRRLGGSKPSLSVNPPLDPAVLSSSGGRGRPSSALQSSPTPTTPTSQILSSCDLVARCGIRLVCWDFDLTVLSIHAYAERIEASAVPARNMDTDFRDRAFFTCLCRNLVARGVAVGCASFGRYDVIQAYMDCAFGVAPSSLSSASGGAGSASAGADAVQGGAADERLFSQQNIVTPASVGGQDGWTLRDGKNSQIALLMGSIQGITPEQVLFFDDDESNIDRAKEAGFPYAIHVPSGFRAIEWQAAVALLEKNRPLPSLPRPLPCAPIHDNSWQSVACAPPVMTHADSRLNEAASPSSIGSSSSSSPSSHSLLSGIAGLMRSNTAGQDASQTADVTSSTVKTQIRSPDSSSEDNCGR